MRKNKRNYWLAFIFSLGVTMGLFNHLQAMAKTNDSQNNDIGFSVSARIPNDQINKKNTFFDLKMTKGKSQTLKTVIYNTTNQDIKIQTAIHTAYTNSNGTIEYVTPSKSFDKSLKTRMSRITKISGDKVVTVPANGSKTVSAQVEIPNKNFDGVILGGWYFKRVDQKVTGSVKKSMNVTNQYSYVIGLKYTMGKVPSPKLVLGNVKAGMSNYHRGIFPELRNVTPVIVPNVTLHTTIKSKNSGKVVKDVTKKQVQMAPNSVFKYPILTGNKQLQAGNYHLHLVAKNDQHRWVFDKDFTISNEDAQKFNSASVDNSGISIWWLVGLGALGMLVLVGIIWLVIWYIKKRSKQ